MSQSNNLAAQSTVSRYIQLAVLSLAGGGIHPLIYLRQNFELSILESFGITGAELGRCYAILGVIFSVTYLPSGWLADKIRPSWLISISLAATGFLGIWFSTLPDIETLLVIFAGWGIATGLTFWAALIKGVAIIARQDEQGRFFGLLDGGRGLVEAILASIAVAIFAHSVEDHGQTKSASLQNVIYLYVGFMLLLAPIVLFATHNSDSNSGNGDAGSTEGSLLADLKLVLGNFDVWLAGFCVLSGYQLFWATYSFSAYLQTTYGMTAVAVGTITVAKLWMRPIGAVTAGFIGDRFNREKTLSVLMFSGTIALSLAHCCTLNGSRWRDPRVGPGCRLGDLCDPGHLLGDAGKLRPTGSNPGARDWSDLADRILARCLSTASQWQTPRKVSGAGRLRHLFRRDRRDGNPRHAGSTLVTVPCLTSQTARTCNRQRCGQRSDMIERDRLVMNLAFGLGRREQSATVKSLMLNLDLRKMNLV